jgi:hypothetical protein
MTRKNAAKKAARAQQAKLGGKYQSHLQDVQRKQKTFPEVVHVTPPKKEN